MEWIDNLLFQLTNAIWHTIIWRSSSIGCSKYSIFVCNNNFNCCIIVFIICAYLQCYFVFGGVLFFWIKSLSCKIFCKNNNLHIFKFSNLEYLENFRCLILHPRLNIPSCLYYILTVICLWIKCLPFESHTYVIK